MGTKIQANSILREYQSLIDLDENMILENDVNSVSFEKVRLTILEHESIIRKQLQEMHLLYKRQRELMNEIDMRRTNKDDNKVDKCRSSYLFPLSPHEDQKRPRNPCHSSLTHLMAGCNKEKWQERFPRLPVNGSNFDRRNHRTSYNRDNGFSLRGVQAYQHNTDASTFDLYFKRNDNPGHRLAYPTDGISDRLTLLRGEISANPCSKLNLVTKDFFRSSLDIMNVGTSPIIPGSRNENTKEQLCDDHPEKKEFSTCQLDISASVSRKRNKIFGVVISEENDEPFDVVTPSMPSNFNQKAQNHHRVFPVYSSSRITNSFAQNLDLGGANMNDGRNKRSLKGLEGNEISSISNHSDMKERCLESCSSIGLNFIGVPRQLNGSNPIKCFETVDNPNIPKEVMKKDSQHYQGGLPWFLRNSQVSGDPSEEKASYFMNLDSLQNHSQKFFGQFETPNGASRNDLNSGENLSEVEKQRGPNNNTSDLKRCIDLNLSLDEEDARSALSLPNAIVKITNTEIDLEAPAAVESEIDASPEQVEPKKSELPYEERDKIVAETMIAISLFTGEKPVDDDSLKWFAEIVSSQCGDSSNVSPMSWSRAHDDEEESIVPDGMDYFEFMTLKSEDTVEKHYWYEPFVLNNPSDGDAEPTCAKRPRRGQSRWGRQRNDFQRNVLPAMITLSRLKVKEDFQAFEELLKQSGSSNRSSTRNGRGRKRSGGANTSPRIKPLCSTQLEQPDCRLVERSLTGWGKRTRRLPRQRCPNALLSCPVKC